MNFPWCSIESTSCNVFSLFAIIVIIYILYAIIDQILHLRKLNSQVSKDNLLNYANKVPGPTYRELLTRIDDKVTVNILSIDYHKDVLIISFVYPGSDVSLIKSFRLSGITFNNDNNLITNIIKIAAKPTNEFLDYVPENGEIRWNDVIEHTYSYIFFAHPDTIPNLFTKR